MNATDVIQQYKLLPEIEQAKVAEFIQSSATGTVRYANDESVLATAKQVFDQHPELFHRLAQ